MANYTQQHLADTLKILMHEQQLDTITVQQLVARARVNRKTFYYHFHGIDDLLCWMYTDAFERVSPSSESNLFTWQRLMDQAMDFMRSEAFYLCAISDSRYRPHSGRRCAVCMSVRQIASSHQSLCCMSSSIRRMWSFPRMSASIFGDIIPARSAVCWNGGSERECRSRTTFLSMSFSGCQAQISMR